MLYELEDDIHTHYHYVTFTKNVFLKFFDEKYYKYLHETIQPLYNEDGVKYIVHLKDDDVVMTRSQLEAYYSTLINDMMESDSENYLDLTLDEFNDPSFENLSYLNSRLLIVHIRLKYYKIADEYFSDNCFQSFIF